MSDAARPPLPAGVVQQISLRVGAFPEMSAPPAYANFVHAMPSPHDLVLRFGYFAIPVPSSPVDAPTEIEAPVQPVIDLAIPLNLVRAFADLLVAQATAWESSFGKIPAMHGGESEQ